MLPLDASQLALIQDPIVHWAYWLASHHGRFEENNVRILEFKTLP